ncbi:MAG: sigma-70 family RNA polymerase sigma factor [Planctomycetes bacterium]|nr:sigma-70 family RNA polymerase sigma factor [Planctomycetota bacterium]
MVKTHQAALLRYLRYLGCEENLAQDMAQDTFVATINADFALTNDKSTASYLRTTARNFYFMWLRKRKNLIDLPDEVLIEQTWQEHEQGDEGESYRQALRDCLQTLTARARRALNMRFAENASREQIALATRLEPEGVKTLLRRAKDKLRDCINQKVAK